jgi:aspartate aminotransferase-like enzyme
VNVPEGVDAQRLLGLMREEHGVVLAGGQQSLSGKIFRVGHMGYTTAEDIQDVLDSLVVVLPQVGFS